MTALLRRGSNGPAVAHVQRLLNQRLTPSPNLTADGAFGTLTHNAVVKFQRSCWLTPDGIVGRCTLNALEQTETYVHYNPPAHLIPQPTNTTCWAAATSMLTRIPLWQVIALGIASGVADKDGLSNDSDTDAFAYTDAFAKTFRLKFLYPQSWLPKALANLFATRGPLMLDTLWNADDYVQGIGSGGHMRIIAGIRGDDTADGTTLLLYDPWKPTVGLIESVIYGARVRAHPTFTYRIFHM